MLAAAPGPVQPSPAPDVTTRPHASSLAPPPLIRSPPVHHEDNAAPEKSHEETGKSSHETPCKPFFNQGNADACPDDRAYEYYYSLNKILLEAEMKTASVSVSLAYLGMLPDFLPTAAG